MKVSIRGREGPLARETAAEASRLGLEVSDASPDCIIYLPGSLEELEQIVQAGGFERLVLRSHAYAYGSSTKNPGLMTEERVSLLPAASEEQRWLRAETIAVRWPNTAVIRLTNVLAREEGDLAVEQISRRVGVQLAGHDPNLQFIGVRDAARALAMAAASSATGIFNAAGSGTIPWKKTLRAAGAIRVPRPRLLTRGGRLDALQYNWTVSGERAERELGFRPEKSSVEALAEFLRDKPGARPGLLAQSFDEFGLDVDYIRAWGWWFAFLRKVYWRIEHEGLENIPEKGRAMFVSNHRGFMPLDAVIHLSLVFTQRGRVIRFLILPSLLRFPYLCNFLTKLGGVIANQENAARLFAAENLVGIFPEGIRGTFTPYKRTYRLRDFSKSAFVKIAIENQTPIIPCAVIGHSEIFPIIGRINSSYVTREFGWPYLPIAPMFPLAPVPIPSKWHVRVLPPVTLEGLRPEDAENVRLLREFSHYIQGIVQRNIDDMLPKRKSIFWGKVLNGTAPETPPFKRASAKPGHSATA